MRSSTNFLDELGGSRLTGASQLRRLAELPFVDTVTALGVRNVDRVEVRELRAILVEVARRGQVVGFDVVELNPARDPFGATSRVAAWIVTHFLSEIFGQPR